MPIHLVLPITLTIAAGAVLVHVWIAFRVGQMRAVHKVSIGDGGAEPLVARMRAHANYVENAPFFLILLGLVVLRRLSRAGEEPCLRGRARWRIGQQRAADGAVRAVATVRPIPSLCHRR